jgi:parvulin-like peptidyl-prolyl isomerase
LLAVFAACSSGDERWIAKVDGVPIAFEELQRVVQARFEEDPETPHEDILNQELNRLVSDRVILNRAQALDIDVTPSEVEARLRGLHGNEQRMDPQFLEEVRKEMILQRTALVDLADRVGVKESTLVHYFEDNRARYRSPERVQIRQIVIEEEAKARRLLAELRAGGDFASAAAQHSLAPEASEGGLLPPFARGEMPEVFERAFELEPGELSEVIESPYGFHIFFLDAKIPAREPELEAVRGQLRAELEQERLAKLKREWLRGLLRGSDIHVNEGLLETLR